MATLINICYNDGKVEEDAIVSNIGKLVSGSHNSVKKELCPACGKKIKYVDPEYPEACNCNGYYNPSDLMKAILKNGIYGEVEITISACQKHHISVKEENNG